MCPIGSVLMLSDRDPNFTHFMGFMFATLIGKMLLHQTHQTVLETLSSKIPEQKIWQESIPPCCLCYFLRELSLLKITYTSQQNKVPLSNVKATSITKL